MTTPFSGSYGTMLAARAVKAASRRRRPVLTPSMSTTFPSAPDARDGHHAAYRHCSAFAVVTESWRRFGRERMRRRADRADTARSTVVGIAEFPSRSVLGERASSCSYRWRRSVPPADARFFSFLWNDPPHGGVGARAASEASDMPYANVRPTRPS
jgi:hypothetical protein